MTLYCKDCANWESWEEFGICLGTCKVLVDLDAMPMCVKQEPMCFNQEAGKRRCKFFEKRKAGKSLKRVLADLTRAEKSKGTPRQIKLRGPRT